MLSAYNATPIHIERLSTSERLMEVSFIFDSYPPGPVNPEHRPSRKTSTKEFSEPGSNLQAGTNINDQFRVLSALGEGGMSFVYLCDDLILNRRVAIKMMRERISNEQAMLRFQREGVAVASLSNEHIVKVFGLQFTAEDQPFLVMEAVEGMTLAKLLEIQGCFPLARVQKFVSQICDGISHAHKMGVIHRDLKLSNIMVINPGSSNETIKILDFGIAKIASESIVKMTQTGEVFGSPAYMSPEQALGKNVTDKTDQYSLGCIAFELLTGQTPFSSDNHLAVLISHVQDKPPSVNEFCQHPLPVYVDKTISRLLAKEPEQRFANVEAARDALTNKADQTLESHVFDKRTVALLGCVLLLLAGFLLWFAFSPSHSLSGSASHRAITLETDKNLLELVEHDSDDAYFHTIIGRNKALRNFGEQLRNRNITDTGFKFIKECSYLNVLDLSGCEKLTDASLNNLLELPITDLNFEKTNFTDEGLAIISNIKRLQRLNIDNMNKVTDAGIKHLVNLPNLKQLSLSESETVTGQSLKYISQINGLESLRLNNVDVSAGLHYLADTKLKSISIKGIEPKPKDVLTLAKIETLQELRMEKDSLPGETILGFVNSPHLTLLDVKGSFVEPDVVQKFHKQKPDCRLIQ